RTREGLQRARLEGRIGGRRKGSTGRLKLDPQRDKVGELHALGLTTPKLAKYFGVTEKTMRKFLARHFPKKAPD
ncbi:resolvase, partial [Salmonella enterica]|nr:resolvase [Salmonella enterica]